MKKLVNCVATVLIFSGLTSENKAVTIGEHWVTPGAAVAGVGAGGLTWFIANQVGCDKAWLKTFLSAGVGGLSAYAAYKILYMLTPQGKYERALKIFNKVYADDLIARSFSSAEDVRKFVTARHGDSGWPLVDGCNTLATMIRDLSEASDLVEDALAYGPDGSLLGKCQRLKKKIKILRLRAEERGDQIRADQEEYERQYKRWQKDQELKLEKEKLAQEHAHHADQMKLQHEQLSQQADLQHDQLGQQHQHHADQMNFQQQQLWLQQQQMAQQQQVLNAALHRP